ncbi:MAG: hypothetical protein K8R36_25525, partial [Planctomycetales bacterium]|nr:hypothetical protein [Planctomycetales bacterium]
MSIFVACRCGQAFEADAWLAGKVVQCPACHSPIAVPTPAAEAAPVYVPRPRPALTHEARETAQSLITILVVAAVILIVVVGLSISLVGYLKGTNPVAWFERLPTREKPVSAPPAETQPSSTLAGPVPATPPAAAAATATSAGNLPSGWKFYDHTDGRFSALFSESPSTQEQTVETAGGDTTRFILVVTQYDHVYEASRQIRSYSIAPGNEETAYAAILSRQASELEGCKVEGSKYTTVDGKKVCDAIIRASEDG